MADRVLGIASLDEERCGTPVQGMLSVRIFRAEAITQQISEQLLVPVDTPAQLDEEEVPLLEAGELPAGVAPPGHHRAALRVERVEDRRGEQEVTGISGLAVQYLGAEEVRDGTRRLRQVGEEETGSD